MNPKKINSRIFLVLAAFATFVISCSNHGKKVAVEGTKGEVLYKGEGVTEADAKKLGTFLKDNGYFDNQEKSVQIRKEGGNYELRFVVDYDKVKEMQGADEAYTLYGAQIAKQVFNSTPTVVILTDKNLKDLKTYAYKPEVLESPTAKTAKEVKEMGQKKLGDNIMYYGKNVTEEEANGVFEYLKSSQFFSEGGHNQLIVTKGENDLAKFQFPVAKEFTNEEGLAKIDAFVKQMKSELFPNNPLAFEVMDAELNTVKTFNY